ncbi:MAG: hypothetical protein IPG58_19850 [Acidobacteria bacterium]|nr:hypothetical protein [Acidobacteriota bacterium]
MNGEYANQFDYYIRLLESDGVYLDRFYDSIWNRKSSDLGAEFAGFVYENALFMLIFPTFSK